VRDHRTEFRVATMCRVLGIHRSGFYAWMRTPISRRSVENERLLEQIRHFWNESDGVYGSPRIFIDLREAGESCGENRVARLMRENGITAIAKRRERGSSYVKPEQVSSNILDREFDQDELDTAWATGDSDAVGFSQYLHPDLGRLAVPRDCHGPRFSASHWVVDAANHAP
jgi:putative transposase